MTAFSTQVVVASLSLSNIAYTHASQVVALSLAQGVPNMLATQLAASSIGAPTPTARVSQVTRNALILQAPRVYASQAVLQILLWNFEVPMPATFPVLPGLAFSVIKRPKFFTGIASSTTGREVRVSYAQNPLWEWDLTYDYLPDQRTASSASDSDLKTLLGFYLSVGGSFSTFRFKDPDDNAVSGQFLGETDGANTTWVLARAIGGSSGAGAEPIGWLDTSLPFHLYLNGALVNPTTYDVLTTLGVLQQVRFHAAPAAGQALTCDMSYFYSVRFKDDTYDFEKFMDKLWSTHTVTLVSQRS